MGRSDSNKYRAKGKAARVHQNISRSIDHIADLYHVFKEYHPEQATMLEIMGSQLLIVLDEWEDFWRTNWGELPTNWDSWI